MKYEENQALPEHVIRQVIAEEKLRSQVREELERERKGTNASKSGLWMFLNSAFGVFLLSSIFVTGLGGLFTYWSQHARERDARIREEKKLLAEFDFRLKELQTRIAEIQSATNVEDKGALTVYIWRAARGNSDYQPAVPEFKNVHWADIIIQLESFGISEGASEAIAATRDLETGVGVVTPKGYTVFPANYLEQRESILQKYDEKAWKKVDPTRIPGIPTL